LAVLPLIALVAYRSRNPGEFSLAMTDRDGILRCATEMLAGIGLCRLCTTHRLTQRRAEALFWGGLVLLGVAMFGSFVEVLCLPAFMLLIAACFYSVPSASKLFAGRLVHFLGEISFSIYLVHWFLLELSARFLWDSGISGEEAFLLLIAPIVLVLPLAALLYFKLEAWGQATGRTLVAYLRRRDAECAVASTPGFRSTTPRPS
jgi:peptidoglycan/LPS O-acetylase OafA/YrhL